MNKRRLLTAILLPFMVSCEHSARVIDPLPPPIVYAEPSAPAPYRPTPEPTTPRTVRSIRGVTIVVDAGHGGKDTGALGRGGMNEKDLVLSIGREVIRQLEARGATVIATRSSDRFIELEDRAKIAERSKADLFVSIHADSAPNNKDASGFAVFIYNQASLQSQKAAYAILGAIKRAGLETRGIYRGNLKVLREHSRPAVLIECGFLTNANDRRLLNDSAYRQRLASLIVEGIADYFGQ